MEVLAPPITPRTTAQDVLDDKRLMFLQRTLSKRPPEGLEPAINWLANKLPGDVKAQLDATSLIATAKTAPTSAKNAPDALRIIATTSRTAPRVTMRTSYIRS